MTVVLSADQPISEAVRALLADQLATLLEQKSHFGSGDRKDAVHRMRVSIRRMRALMKLYGQWYSPSVRGGLEKGMKRTARKLGAVRDLDVLVDHLAEYQASLPEEEQAGFEPLLAVWQARRHASRQELVHYLESKRFRSFVDDLTTFVSAPGSGVIDVGDEVTPYLVKHVLGSSIWKLYETVWAYAPTLEGAPPETLHALRIECKYLRYGLEFFRDLLGEKKATVLITQVTALQDYLGDVHDADVAGDILGKPAKGMDELQDAYLIARTTGSEQRSTAFAPLWAKVDSVRFRRQLASMLVVL